MSKRKKPRWKGRTPVENAGPESPMSEGQKPPVSATALTVSNAVTEPQASVEAKPPPTAFEEHLADRTTISFRLTWSIIDACVAAIWIYVVLKLFVFDVDVALVNLLAPSLAWLLSYKLFVVLGLVATAFVILGTKVVLLAAAYLFVFPILAVMWKLPRFILRRKSWVLLLAMLNALVGFLRSFRRNIIMTSMWAIATVTTLTAESFYVLSGASIALLLLLSFIYVRAFAAVFRPSPIYQLYKNTFSGLRASLALSSVPAESFGDPSLLNDENKKKWASKIELPLIFNRLCLIVARRLRDFQSSGVSVVSATLHIVFIMGATVASLASVNFALFTADKQAFDATVVPTFFTFLFYSLNNVIFNFIKELTPASSLAQAIWMLGVLFAFLLVCVLIALIITERARRQDEELKAVIIVIEEEGREMESFLSRHYGVVDVENVVQELERLKSGLSKILLFLSQRLK